MTEEIIKMKLDVIDKMLGDMGRNIPHAYTLQEIDNLVRNYPQAAERVESLRNKHFEIQVSKFVEDPNIKVIDNDRLHKDPGYKPLRLHRLPSYTEPLPEIVFSLKAAKDAKDGEELSAIFGGNEQLRDYMNRNHNKRIVSLKIMTLWSAWQGLDWEDEEDIF